MKKLEINDIIGSLDGEEFRKFGAFISSPYFAVSKRVADLYQFISRNYSSAVSGKLPRLQAAEAVLGSSFSDDNARKLFSDLNKAVEDFLLIEAFQHDEKKRQLSLLKALRKKGEMYKHAQKLKEFTRLLGTMEPGQLSYRLGSEASEEEFTAEDPESFHEYSPALQKWSSMLDAYYITSKLLIYEYMYSKQLLNKSGQNYTWSMADEISSFIESNRETIQEDNPDIYLKYLMIKMIREKDDSLMVEYSEFLRNNESRFSTESTASFYSDLYNYATIRIGAGRHEFRRPFFNLIKEIEPRGLLLDDGGMIHTYSFKQIADTAFHLKEIAWAGGFIKKYSDKLSTKSPRNILSLMNAKLLYYNDSPAGARLELEKVSPDDFIVYLDSKSFRICMEYDEGDFSSCIMNIEALSKYLKHRKEIPETMVQNAIRFKYYIRKLIDFKEHSADSFYLFKLAEELNTEDAPVYGKEWIRDKIEELEKK